MVNNKPTDTPSKVPTAVQTSGNNPNDTPITVPTTIQISVIKKGIEPDKPPKNVATSHLKDPISTTTNLDEACPLDTSCDHLPHLDSRSLSSELQDNSSVDHVEIELLPESEEQLDYTNLSPTDVSSEQHEYGLVLLQKEFDAPNDTLNHHDIHNCENQDDILIHATNLSYTFALPQFMAQHNCEDQDPTDGPSAVPTASQASCDHTIKPKCDHNPMDFPVQWSKFIHTSPKPRMTKTPFQITVHVAYSPIASTHVDSCSRKLTAEGNTQSTLWLTGEVMELIQLDTTSLKWIGELFMTQVSSFSWQTLIMMQSQKISSHKSFGKDNQKGHLPPLSEA